MKKILLLCGMIVALLTACSEQQTMESILDEEFVNIAKGYISASQAVDIANDFAADFNDEPGSRSENRKASSTRNVMTIRARASRSAEDLIYVVNYDDDQGFALVSKKETSTPVLAFIPKGTYSDETAAKIGGFQDFVTNAHEYIYQGKPNWRDSIINSRDSIIRTWPRDSFPKVVDSIPTLEINSEYFEHFIHLNWATDGVFGKYCPNGEAGCGPLAFAMLCAHYERPKKITITFDKSNREIELDWAKIKVHMFEKHYSFSALDPINPDKDLWPDCKYSSCTKDSHDQLGLLLRQIGYDFGSLYTLDGTSTTAKSMYINMTKYKDYNATPVVKFDPWFLKYYSNKRMPVIMFGSMPTYNDNDTPSGHIWICDGYKTMDQDKDGEDEDYFHYNWGYGGEFNGFFLSGVFHLKEGWFNYVDIKQIYITPK
ncbi:MAG: C10 family peptidase [Muribaculaceae bacterium]|nr:C10 family peptidase [Muribaculaceae bacterium]